LDALRETLRQSVEQVKLKTERERLRVEALRKQIEESQLAKRKKKGEEEKSGLHY